MPTESSPKSITPLRRAIKLWNRYFPCDRLLAQRIAKATCNSTTAFIFVLIPQIRNRIGDSPSLLPLISVMVHPGRRVSGTIQGAIYCLTGLVFGLAYALFARFLATRCLGSDWNKLTDHEHWIAHPVRYESALGVLALFETLMLLFHGWMRSVNHTYFGIVFPVFLVVHFTFLEPLYETPGFVAKSFTVPFYMGIAMSIVWNLILFPEFGSTYLGNATIDTLNEIQRAIDHSINFFISIDLTKEEAIYNKEPSPLPKLLNIKNIISKKVSGCNAVYQECIYEISYSYVSPTQLNGIIKSFDPFVMYLKGIINACQLEFILLGKEQNENLNKGNGSPSEDKWNPNIDKEIEYADAKKLLTILKKIRPEVYNLHKCISENMYMMKLVLAYAYDADLKKIKPCSMFKDGNYPIYRSSKDFPADFDFSTKITSLESAIINFDLGFREQLVSVSDSLLTPNDEMFLLSSFLMNFKEVATSVQAMMKDVEEIYAFRKEREKKGWLRGKTVWFTFLRSFDTLKAWLLNTYSNNNLLTENEAIKGTYNNEGQGAHTQAGRSLVQEEDLLRQNVEGDINIYGSDNENNASLPISNNELLNPNRAHEMKSFITKCKRYFTSYLIWCNAFFKRSRSHFRFAIQVATALQLSSFPMFMPSARDWYISYHGAWIGFVCILCMEPSVGGTFWVFFLRAVGVISGSGWAYLSYVSAVSQTNPYLETVISVFGAIPGFYFLIGTPYVKAAIIQIISIYIVILAAVYPGDTQGGILVNFAKRCLAVGYGGGVSLMVQVFVFPIKSRDMLNQEIAFVCGCISRMELLYASGLEGESLQTPLTEKRFNSYHTLSKAAKAALSRADAYKGLTRQEPRLKGPYKEIEDIFTQIIFLQKQIIDRMDNVAMLRMKYGSAVIEELNSIVYPYRRQVVANISVLMRSLQEAFINKTPLPQFLPSARISHRRLINKVRETLQVKYRGQLNIFRNKKSSSEKSSITSSSSLTSNSSDSLGELVINVDRANKKWNPSSVHEHIIKENFLSWNATTAASEEIIEYIEELINLTKILVGVNEFKYGFLSRPLYVDWAVQAVTGFDDFIQGKTQTQKPSRSQTPFQAVSSLAQETIPESLGSELNEENNLYTENSVISVNADEPKPYTKDGNSAFPSNVILARIASYKGSGSSAFRKRIYSIGSPSDTDYQATLLSRKKTIGDVDSEYYNTDNEYSSDEDLPLALKKIMSNKSRK
ncbi:hypothetical protein TPHA_0B04410 [Tetrapisispora phaffii CBS 4417]|uniref:Uncharacterized protein n=1 Tax=Tetrapisispora phaffii (strain ATCC 24235 / CBS 4417 / NBRC 1672 / NRRL Y-8282 / UCD 70-5) TaxID=1071381 RepID=G8BQ29_TETPH|nr:hypothetical protein TPHA_0B04410 [Tetrapisispora phaffii CBS 4417]CCE62110.1 hypothetical protein TPHA_0B04410 [Tetrapisispora phaffii CBS 4417]